MGLKELLKDCEINKRTNTVCQSEDFWKQYNYKNYGLKVVRPGLDAKATAIISDKLLKEMWQNELYPTVKSFNYIIEYVKDFDDVFGISKQQLVSMMGTDDNPETKIKQTSDYFKTQLPEIENGNMGNLNIEWGNHGLIHFVLNSLAKQNIKTILDFIYVDTKYLAPNGITTLPLDYDKYMYFEYLSNNHKLNNVIDGMVRLKAKEYIIRYL